MTPTILVVSFGLNFKDQWTRLDIKGLKSGIACIIDFINGKDKPGIWVTVTQNNFPKYFNTNNYSFDLFLSEILEKRKEILRLMNEESKNKSDASMGVDSLVNGNDDHRNVSLDLFTTPKFLNKFSQADDDFIFNRLFKDKDKNLYMELLDKLYLVPFDSYKERLIVGNTTDDDNIWSPFFKQFKANIDKWNETIMEVINNYSWEGCEKQIEELMMEAGVPRIYLECLMLKITQRGVEEPTEKGTKKKWYYENCSVVPDNGTQKSNWKLDNMIKAFSKNLLTSVDFNKVKAIKSYTNNPSEKALKHLNIPIARKFNEEPKLPPTWDMFFGNGRFFNPITDKMKIACFIYNSLKAEYSGRQVLVIGGDGDDGKGIFINLLQNIIGIDHTCAMNVNDFANEDRFGLMKSFNKKILFLSDCKKVAQLFEQDKFKALTGGDTVTLEAKGKNPIQWTPQGLTIAIATNYPFYVSCEYGKSRCMPLVFRKNYTPETQMDRLVLTNKLIAEKDEFLQWCVDYRMWCREKYEKLMVNDVLVMCSDADLSNLTKLDQSTLFKNMCETLLIKNETTKLVRWNEWTEEDEFKQAEFDDVFKKFFKYYLDTNYSSFSKLKTGKCYTTLKDLIEWMNDELGKCQYIVGDNGYIGNENTVSFFKSLCYLGLNENKRNGINCSSKNPIYKSLIQFFSSYTSIEGYEFKYKKRYTYEDSIRNIIYVDKEDGFFPEDTSENRKSDSYVNRLNQKTEGVI